MFIFCFEDLMVDQQQKHIMEKNKELINFCFFGLGKKKSLEFLFLLLLLFVGCYQAF